MNKSAAKASYLMITVGVILAALGFIYRINYQQCLGMDGSNGIFVLCDADNSLMLFTIGFPIMSIGIIVSALAKRNAPVLRRIFGS